MVHFELPKYVETNNVYDVSTKNKIIFAKSFGNYYYPNHETPYLFVTNYINPGNYYLNEKYTSIKINSFYFLNANDTISIDYSKPAPRQTLLILFDPDFINNCILNISSTDKMLLELPDFSSTPEFHIPEVPFELTGKIQQTISAVLRENKLAEELDCLLFDLIAEFTNLNKETINKINKIDAIKTSTKTELYKRIFTAKSFISENVTEKITLDQLAAVAGLNKFHLLSTFKRIFHITPHQFSTQLKLEKAHYLLKNKKGTVTEICEMVGFESAGSFSNLFKKHYRIAPSELFKN